MSTTGAAGRPLTRRPPIAWLVTPFRSLARAWRRSLRARVVMLTLLLSTAVVLLVGWMLLRQVTDGVIETKQQTSLQEAESGFVDAQATLDAADPASQEATQLVIDLFRRLDDKGRATEFYRLVMVGPVGTLTSPDVDPGSVPKPLLQAVASDPQHSHWTYTRVRSTAAPGMPQSEHSVPALAVSRQLESATDTGTYTLTYIFPMQEQQDTLNVVRRAMLTAGSLLVVLVAGVAYVVTRQVVTPVRLARRIAERLASGRLQERMQVRGEDDIARLGMSFNQMAGNLQSQIEQLEELSRVQRRFVSDVSHELRTPLTTVRMAADVLYEARERFDGSTARSAELLQNELGRFEDLLSDLLEISRFDAGVAALDVERVDLSEVARQVVESTRSLADRRGCRVLVREPDRACVAYGDVRRIERIVRNLVNNAIDHGEGRDVVISLGADDEASALAVRDHGVGLTPDQATRVFNRFWRADLARARSTGGTGLGLAIAREDARLHGGWLEAWGWPGDGAYFRLTLPRQAGGPLRGSPLPMRPVDADASVPAAAGPAGAADLPSTGRTSADRAAGSQLAADRERDDRSPAAEPAIDQVGSPPTDAATDVASLSGTTGDRAAARPGTDGGR